MLTATALRLLRPLLPAALAALGSCASTAEGVVDEYPPEQALAWALRERAAGNGADALEALALLRAREGLAPEFLNRTERELVDAVTARIEELEARPDGTDELLELFELELPRRLQAQAGVAAAAAQLRDGQRIDAFQTIRELDRDDPGHAERGRAAEILARAGLSLAADPGRFFLGLFTYRSRAPRVLDYLVLTYPAHPSCAEAYHVLATLYEEDGEWELAISAREELILYHRNSQWGVLSELEIPELRMQQLKRVDYDRGGLVQAREELRTWRARHAGHALAPRADHLFAECLERLARHDLVVARFYLDVEKPYGAWQHAERALLEAEEGGRDELVDEIRAFLAALPPADRLLEDVRVLEPEPGPGGT